LEYFFVNENFLRFLRPEYGDKYGSGHDTFKGMALVWFIVASLPWLPLAVGTGVWKRGKQKKERGHSRLRIMEWKDFSGRPELALPLLGCLCMTAFWCLTSRALLPYLLPAAPLVAMWAAVKLDEWGVLDSTWLARGLNGMASFACVVVWIGMGIAIWLGQNVSGKMPRRMYRELQRIQRETPAYADAKFEFINNDPYSSEFYLGDAARHYPPPEVPSDPAIIKQKLDHAREAMARDAEKFHALNRSIQTKHARGVLERSAGDFVILEKKQMELFDEPPQRDAVFSNRYWVVFAPVASEAQ
jgi:hypothetical protein